MEYKLSPKIFAPETSSEKPSYRYLMAKQSAAGPLWIPILQAFEKEVATNKNFTITAMTHKETGGYYNDDTQSDIYVYPSQGVFTYMHVLAHEIAHLFSLKHQPYPQEFLEKFQQVMEKDGLLDPRSESYVRLPELLRDLLDNMRRHYDKAQHPLELFPRVCVQFPILYALSHPSCTQEDLLDMMENLMPETFKLYCELVAKGMRI